MKYATPRRLRGALTVLLLVAAVGCSDARHATEPFPFEPAL